MGKIDAIILAGGLGTRLKGAVSNLPKVLAPVNGKPFLDILLHILDRSEKTGKVILAVGYMADKIIERYRDSNAYRFRIAFSVETDPLGTGGAVKKALGYSETDNVLVMNGDSYVEVDLEEMFAAHSARNAALTVVIKEVPDAGRYGRVLIDAGGRVVSFEEKRVDAGSGYVNAGVYLLNRNLFEKVEEEKAFSLEKELLPAILGEAVYGFVSQGKFIDIGIPETYFMSGDYLKEIIP